MNRRADHPFGKDELLDSDGFASDPAELAAVMKVAGELEQVAQEPRVRPSPEFVDRVSSAIAKEPRPAPVAAARESLRRRSPIGFFGALRDAGRVAFGAGRPAAVRGQAFALVLAALLIVTSLGGATALAASQLFAPGPVPTRIPATQSPSPTPGPAQPEPSGPTLGPDPTPTAGETEIPGESGGHATDGPGESPRPSASSGGETDAGESPEPTRSFEPSQSPGPGQSQRPTDTPRPTGSGHH